MQLSFNKRFVVGSVLLAAICTTLLSCGITTSGYVTSSYPRIEEIPSFTVLLASIDLEKHGFPKESSLARVHMAIKSGDYWEAFFTFREGDAPPDWNSLFVAFRGGSLDLEFRPSGYLTPYFFEDAIVLEDLALDSVNAYELAMASGGKDFIEEHPIPSKTGNSVIIDLHPTRDTEGEIGLIWSISYSADDAHMRVDMDAYSGEVVDVFHSLP